MSLSLLRPNGTVSISGSVNNAATAHAALSDDSDATYVHLDAEQQVTVSLGDFALPADAIVKAIQLSVRVAVDGVAPLELRAASGGKSTTAHFDVTWGSPATVVGRQVLDWTDADVNAATLQVVHTGSPGGESGGGGGGDGALSIYEAFFRVIYVVQPTVVVDAPTGVLSTNLPLISWTPTLDPDG